MKNSVLLRVQNTTQLARIYRVSYPKMKAWIKEILPFLATLGSIKGRLWNIRQVEHIVTYLGPPEEK